MSQVKLVMRTGHILLPNGLGLTCTPDERAFAIVPNELASSEPRATHTRHPVLRHAP